MLTKQKQQANQRPDARGMSLEDYRFAQEHLFRRNLLSSVSTRERRDRKKKLAKIKVLLYERLRTPSEACPQRMLLRNESKGMITPCTRFAS
jgi:hypothetical protein